MSDVTKVVQKIIKTGLDPTHTGGLSAADTYQMLNNGRMFIYVTNGGGGTVVVTIATPGTVDGLAIADRAVTLLTGTDRMIGPFPPHIYNNSSGEIEVTFDVVASVTLAALNLG